MAFVPGGPQPAALPGAGSPMAAPMAAPMGAAPAPVMARAPVQAPPNGGMPQMPPMMAPPMAPQPPPMFHDVKIRRTQKTERALCTPVPPEEFGISSYARSIKDTGYCFHDVIRRESELINDGYSKAQVEKLSAYTGQQNDEELSRDTVEERSGGGEDSGLNKANRELRITEHYIVMDYEGDGKPCMYKVVTGGEPSEILSREGEDDVMKWEGPPPFAAGCPRPQTHRFYGSSIADLVMEVQRIKTALIRGALNSIYLQVNQRTEVAESNAGVNTIDDLLTNRPGGIVRTKTPGGLNPIVVPDVTQGVMQALQYVDTEREWRTGVARQGQGINPDALQNQVATIANQMENASQSKVKMIARILAETGVRDMFLLLHSTIRRHGSIKQTVELRGKWVTVDPRDWKLRNQMKVNVGLGTGSKASLLAQMQLLMTYQEKAAQIGMVTKGRFYNAARDLVRLIKPGGDCNAYFKDPGIPDDPQDPALQPVPDPKMAEVQAKMAIEQGKQQAAGQQFQLKMALEDKQAQDDIASKRMDQKGAAELNQQKFAFEQQMASATAAMEERRMIGEAQLRERQAAHEMALKDRAMAHELAIKERESALTLRHMDLEFQLKAREDARKAMMEEATARAATATRTKKVVRKDGKIDSITETIDEKS